MKEWEKARLKWRPDSATYKNWEKVVFKEGWDAGVKSSAELLRKNYGHLEKDMHKEVQTAYRQITQLLADDHDSPQSEP